MIGAWPRAICMIGASRRNWSVAFEAYGGLEWPAVGGPDISVFRKPDGPEGFGFVMASRT